jgi:hypothetical protein
VTAATELFVAVLRDRHVDDAITVHATRASADGAVDAFMSAYGDDYGEWHERDLGGNWVRYVETDSDDGPKARIERMHLKGG